MWGNLSGHPLKGCLSRAKTFPMQEKEVFKALPFPGDSGDVLALVLYRKYG
jgi:hypothetical protein